MVKYCCVSVCKRKHCAGENISFHCFPRKDNMRRAWLAAVKLTESRLVKSKDLRVCSQHFRPTDYIFGSNIRQLKTAAVPSILLDTSDKEDMMETGNVVIAVEHTTDTMQNDNEVLILQNEAKQFIEENTVLKDKVTSYAKRIEILESQVVMLQKEMEYLTKENEKLEEQHQRKGPAFNLKRFEENDKKILYYTGFENYAIMKGMYDFILPQDNNNILTIYHNDSDTNRGMSLSMENQFFLTMIRLRRGFNYETLGDLFDISKSSSAKICLWWIDLLFTQLLGNLELWRSRDCLIANAPLEFQQKHKNVVGSINCTEFFIERPSLLAKQSQCYSQYKSSTTMKSLLMTDPSGVIIYFSSLFTGSISDKNIIIQSGFQDILKEKVRNGDLFPGDVILADKGFNIQSLLEDIDINIPTFKISGTQFTEEEVQWIRDVAQEKVHVERSIGRLKQYRILSSKICIGPLDTIERVYAICCTLCNFR